MTHTQFKVALIRLNLTQAPCARIIGVTDRQVRRWAAGDCEVPAPVTKLLVLMIAGRVSAAMVEAA